MGKPGGARIDYLICVLLAVVILALYWQTVGFDFTHFDDNALRVGNGFRHYHIRGPAGYWRGWIA